MFILFSGFMKIEDLRRIFRDKVTNLSLMTEFITLMQKFEVVLQLDEQRLLIPSLLPPLEEDACIVFPKAISIEQSKASCVDHLRKEPHASIQHIPHPLLVRYYLLPFVPNGFFPRLIARIISSNIMTDLRRSLSVNLMEEHHVLNVIHWLCWRSGIVLIWNHMEILRIGPLTCPFPGMNSAVVITNSGSSQVETGKGIEIKVAVLPDECIKSCSSVVKNPEGVEHIHEKGKCFATWLLHQAAEKVDSVFEDWYEVFAYKRGFEMSKVRTANPCPKCYENVRAAEISPRVRRMTFSLSLPGWELISRKDDKEKVLYMFSNAYCALVVANGNKLKCPAHEELTVAEVAPDLVSVCVCVRERERERDLVSFKRSMSHCPTCTVQVFGDLAPSMLFTSPSSVITKQTLGDGGFGTVLMGTLNKVVSS